MKFVFPQNYKFQTRLLGFFDYPTLIFNILFFLFLFVISNLIFNNLEFKIIFCTCLFLPIFLLSFIGLKQENIFFLLISFLFFIKNRKIYFYSKI